MVPATRPLEPSFRQKSFQKPSILSGQAARSGSPPGPRSKKNTLFWKGFRARACTDLLGKRTQERLFLQRNKSEYKSSHRVRGMGPPQGPAFACTVTILNKTQKQKLKKTRVLFRILISNKHFGARCENTKCLFDIRIPNKTCVFFSFCFFVLFSMVRVHAKAGPWGRPHAAYPMGSFERIFRRCKKKHFWAKVHWRSVHARVRKPFRKKCKKTRSGVPPEQRTPRQDQKMKKCVIYKSKNPGDSTHRKWQQERDPERLAPTRQPHLCFVKKNVFFLKKKTCFFLLCSVSGRWVPTSERPWGGRIGRAPSTLCFFTKFLQKNTRPGARRDFRLATGNTLTWRILRD